MPRSQSLSLLLQRAIITCFHLLVIIVPFVFTWVNEELFEFNKMLVTYGLASLIGSFWVMRMVVEQRFLWRRTRFDIPIVLFLISQILATVFSIHPYTSFFGYYTRFHGGLLSTITYILLYYAFVTNVPRSQLPKVLLSTTLAALGVALYAIPEHFGYSPSCYLITDGESFDTSCWIQDVKNRVFATFGQPNWLAAYCITLFPLTTAASILSSGKTQRRLQLLFGSTTIALLLTLLFTQSRSGQLGLAAGLGVFILGCIGLFWKNRVSRRSLLTVGGSLLGLAIAVVVIFGSNYTPRLSQLLSSDQPQPQTSNTDTAAVVNRLDEGGSSSGEIRKIVWSGAVQVARRYPLFGSGVETFAYSYYQDRPLAHNLVSEWDFLYNKAHNEFLNFWATTGVVGLSTYMLLLGWFCWLCVKALLQPKTPSETSLVLLALLAGVIALSISNFFGFSTVMVTVLLFLFFAVTEVLLAKTKDASPVSSVTPAKLDHSPSLTTNHYIGLGLSGLVGVYLLWSVLNMWTADRAFAQGKNWIASGLTFEGLEQLVTAVRQSPQEALFYDELGSTYASLAVALAQQGDSTSAAQLAESAIATQAQSLELNPRHLNFHKTRSRVFITLASLDPEYLKPAAEALKLAITLSPTDAKLRYNLALVELADGQTEQGLATLKTTIEMKPNYESARIELARNLTEQQQFEAATEQYRYILSHINPNNEVVKEYLEIVTASASATR